MTKIAGPLFLAPKSVPKITQATLFLSVSGFLVVFCLLLGLKKHTQPGSFITEPRLGTSGWNPGTAWMMGIGNALWVLDIFTVGLALLIAVTDMLMAAPMALSTLQKKFPDQGRTSR